MEDAIGYTYIDRGHQFWVVNFPTGNATWVYDLTTACGTSAGLGGDLRRERLPGLGHVPPAVPRGSGVHRTEQHYVGGNASGKIYIQSEAYLDDAGDGIYLCAAPRT